MSEDVQSLVLKGDNSIEERENTVGVAKVKDSITEIIRGVYKANSTVRFEYFVKSVGEFFEITFDITSCGCSYSTYCYLMIGKESEVIREICKIHERVNPMRWDVKKNLRGSYYLLQNETSGEVYLDDNNEIQDWRGSVYEHQ